MKTGLNPKTHFGIIIGIAIISFAFLATRAKTIVNDEVRPVSTATSAEDTTDENHIISPDTEKRAEEIRQQYSKDANPLNGYRALAEMFFGASVFDSSAFYFEKIANTNPGLNTWLATGDAYLQAYSLALNQVKAEEMAEKSRNAYSNALKYDPSNLYAKTNTALTFVTSQNPMKAITLLREVLDVQPNYLPAIISMGKLSLQSMQYDKAIERFKEVLKLDRENVDAKIGLAYSYIETGEKDDAKALLNELINSDIDPIVKDELEKVLKSIE